MSDLAGIAEVSSKKEKVEAVEEGSKSLKYSVIEGDLLKYYKDFKGSLSVSSNAQTGSSVKWSCEFQKATEQVPDPVFIKDFAVKTFQDLDAYVLAN
ncbi:hypothetical protein ASNO1_78200 [Corallococcus caeni]|uniref:Bet v I/Major latex protein domain-containing protein n=1 Tax=Corallococcus caeni TaxID=3082388 RepID=A0ABQ6R5W7_9BACT|nr:hypothetical protein ASNO1_78200 [Corallococcus sp. NO1]